MNLENRRKSFETLDNKALYEDEKNIEKKGLHDKIQKDGQSDNVDNLNKEEKNYTGYQK